MQEINGKEPFHSITVQYFDVLQSRVHVLGPSADLAGMQTVRVDLAEVLRGLNYASQQFPGANLLRPGGQVCLKLLARLSELVADLDDNHFTKVISHAADLNWVPGTSLCHYSASAS